MCQSRLEISEAIGSGERPLGMGRRLQGMNIEMIRERMAELKL
jgi:hypothetical protein